jgi:hypothetical protein
MPLESINLPISPEKLATRSLSQRICSLFQRNDQRLRYFVDTKNLVLKGTLDAMAVMQIQAEYQQVHDRDLFQDFAYQWLALLEEITYFIAIDGNIDHAEQRFFHAYVGLFRINHAQAQATYAKGARRAYMDILANCLDDNELTIDEIERLNRVAAHFGIKEHEQNSLIRDRLQRMLQEHFDQILEDGLISDTEWNELEKLRKALRMDMELTPEVQLVVDSARRCWRQLFVISENKNQQLPESS